MVLVVHRSCWAMMVLVVHQSLNLRNYRIPDGVFYQANSAAVSPIRFDDFLALLLVVPLNVVSSASSGG
jgi:hypothetical protein